MCKCKVCNRQFHYGDEWSPMFTNKIWFDLLDFYNLWRYEAEEALGRKLSLDDINTSRFNEPFKRFYFK